MKPINKLSIQDDFVGFYLLKELNMRQTSGTPPKDYFDIVLSDASGQISAKYWDVTIQDKETFLPMQLVKIQGTVLSYGISLKSRSAESGRHPRRMVFR